MREMKKKHVMLAVLMLVLSTLFPYLAANDTVSLSSPITTIHVETKTVPPCTTFPIKITVTDVTNLYEFTINLSYNATFLGYLGFTNGDFWSAVGGKLNVFNPANGELQIRGYPGRPEGATGGGTLAMITFHCAGPGESDLVLHDAELLYPNGTKIPHAKEHGKCAQVTQPSEALHINYNYTLCRDMFSGGTTLFIIEASNVVLDLNGHTLTDYSNVGVAVQVAERLSNVCIMNGTVASFEKGFAIKNCTNVNVTNTMIEDSKVTAVEISMHSSNIQVSKNVLEGRRNAQGIYLDQSSLVNISDNTISNFATGIYMTGSYNNSISKNTITDNGNNGIYASASSNNSIWSNDFINNAHPVYSEMNSVNSWNDSYPYGGNYWNDYSSQPIDDDFSGKNQAIPGPDGIGDKNYTIDSDNHDYYPLMNPCGSRLRVSGVLRELCDIYTNETREVKALSVAVFTPTTSTVADFNFNGTLISFNVDAREENGTFCRVIVSRDLLDGAYEIEVDGIQVASSLHWDRDYVFADFNYSSGSHKVAIKGEMVTKLAGDVNEDGKVNILDLALVALQWNLKVRSKKP